MTKVLRPLALANAAVALAFALPLVVWFTADYFTRSSLVVQVQAPAVASTDQRLAQIQSTKDIEELRRHAKVLAEMRAFDRQHQQVQAYFMQQMVQWVWAFMGIVSAAFLVNAGLLYWAHMRDRRAI